MRSCGFPFFRFCAALNLGIRITFVFVWYLLIASCGSGSSGGDATSNNCGLSDCSPQALILTPSITAYAGQIVQLDGSASRPSGTLSYRWEQVGAQSVSISDANQAIAQFVVPTLDAEQLLSFRLIVSNGFSDSVANLGVVVKPLNVSASTSAPIATVGARVFLKATGGDDSGELRYLWEQVDSSGVTVSIDDADSAIASFSTRVVPEAVAARFRVIITNKFGATAQAETSVDFAKGILPAITAVTPAHTATGEEIKLSGSGFTSVLSLSLIRGGELTEINESNMQVVSDHELRFTVPPIEPGEYQVEVGNSGGKSHSELTIHDPLQNVVQVAAGHSHYCAILKGESPALGGPVVCWGSNVFGALGSGDFEFSIVPTKVRLENDAFLEDAIGISSGSYSSCALRSDRTVWCWGANSHGQLGDGKTIDKNHASMVKGLPGSIVKVSAGAINYCALDLVGDVYCWGNNGRGQIGYSTNPTLIPTKIELVGGLSSVALGSEHACGILSIENTILCWGSNTFGQLGNASRVDSPVPVAVLDENTNNKLSNVREISLGAEHSCAVLHSGKAFCWGKNDTGQLGVGDYFGRKTATKVKNEYGEGDLEGAISIGAGLGGDRETSGSGRTCVLNNSNNLYCWGDNAHGQLGDGLISERSLPVRVENLRSVISFSIGRADGCAIVLGDTAVCWGVNNDAQLGHREKAFGGKPLVVENLSDVTMVSVGGAGRFEASFSCALLSTGIVSCWGHNDKGQLGVGTFMDSASPVPVSLPNVTEISSGGSHSCAVSKEQVYCWGSNTNMNSLYEPNGQFMRTMKLGSDTVDQSPTPLLVKNLANIVSVTAGAEHSCALSRGGDVYCWGDSAGEWTGSSAAAIRITQLPEKANQITAGALGSCALLESGDVYCWHGNVPTRIPLPQGVVVLNMAVGLNQACVVVMGGSIYCWGGNEFGQLGNGSTLASNIPVEVVGINNAQNVTASGAYVYWFPYGYSCALQSHNNGSVSCWGTNALDQLGDGSGMDQAMPVTIKGLHGVKQIASGGTHSCALYHDGYVACWGGFFGGQLGQAPLSPRAVLQ